MNIKYLAAITTMFLVLTGCASTGESRQGQVERITPEELAKLLPPPVATVSLDEIVVDSKQGKSTDDIIAKIIESQSRYELTPTQILGLSKQGVDTKVLEHMQQSNELAKQNAIADEINRREKEKAEVQKQLRNERAFSRNRYYDPFWGSRFGLFYGHGHRYRHGSRYGLGLRYGYPYGW
jgi:hypothetical protein